MGFIDTCADCKNGRKGNCDWASRYRTAMAEAKMPSTYPSLVAFLSELARMESRRKRFPKALLPLLADLLATGREHCLAYVDYAYLNGGVDIESLLLDFFPGYRRSDVLGNCCFPPSFIQRAVTHARKMSVDEMECRQNLILHQVEYPSVGFPMAILVNTGYCREDYTWRNTTEEGGRSIAQAAWIIRQIWLANGQSFAQYKLGKVMGINSIHSYGQRVRDVEPYKESIREVFRSAGLKFE